MAREVAPLRAKLKPRVALGFSDPLHQWRTVREILDGCREMRELSREASSSATIRAPARYHSTCS